MRDWRFRKPAALVALVVGVVQFLYLLRGAEGDVSRFWGGVLDNRISALVLVVTVTLAGVWLLPEIKHRLGLPDDGYLRHSRCPRQAS